VVERFATRPPDQRMVDVLAGAPASTRVLDLGCAGGRNTEWLARHGFDVYACDSSAAMVTRTRARVAEVLGAIEAERRVVCCRMDALQAFAAGAFDVVIALGIYQQAETVAEWHRAVAETARVLKIGGSLLVQHFAPDSNPSGRGLERVEDHVFRAAEGRAHPMVFLAPDVLDAWMARHGLMCAATTRAVKSPTDAGGYWVNVHAFYVRSQDAEGVPGKDSG
jgi:SAM-dependent methyltransferase